MIFGRRRRHAATLANISRLELELGLRERTSFDYPSIWHMYAWADHRTKEKLGTHTEDGP